MDPRAARILDANLNRAREALRVVEEFARFTLEDPHATLRLKQARHALLPLRRQLGDLGLQERDIGGDVGSATKTSAEIRRDSPEEVVRAAFARWSEATRVLGEYGKLVSAEFAAAAETLRYECYDLEQRLLLRGQASQALRQAGLYVILSEALCARPWGETAAAVLGGGARCLQLREKELSDRELLARAKQLRHLTRDAGALLIINDRPDIARLCDADGVHVGQEDLSVAEARRVGGGRLVVGKSTHTPEQFAAALAEQPDYVAIGPMFETTTKPQGYIAGPQTLALVRRLTTMPVVAIGGIGPANVAGVRDAGADLICVCSAVIGNSDPQCAVRELLAAVRKQTVQNPNIA